MEREIYTTMMGHPFDWLVDGEFDIWNFLAENSGKHDYGNADLIYHYFELPLNEREAYKQETEYIRDMSQQEMLTTYNQLMQAVLGMAFSELGKKMTNGEIVALQIPETSILFTDIEWEDDRCEDEALPTKCELPLPDGWEEVDVEMSGSDLLGERFGCDVRSFNYEIVYSI